MDKMTTGTARSSKSARSGSHGLVGSWPPSSAAGAADLNFELTTTCAVLEALDCPLPVPPVDPAADAVVPAAAVAEPAPDVDVDFAPPLLAAAPPGALPIGGTGGGEASTPRPPLKVGLLQFDALSCCAG